MSYKSDKSYADAVSDVWCSDLAYMRTADLAYIPTNETLKTGDFKIVLLRRKIKLRFAKKVCLFHNVTLVPWFVVQF